MILIVETWETNFFVLVCGYFFCFELHHLFFKESLHADHMLTGWDLISIYVDSCTSRSASKRKKYACVDGKTLNWVLHEMIRKHLSFEFYLLSKGPIPLVEN